MNRRHALKALAGLALCPICAPKGFAAERAHWSYDGAGPEQWAELDSESKVCAIGSQQSPIDIAEAVKAELSEIEIGWADSAQSIINNGHTIQLNFGKDSWMRRGETTYQLVQAHFHRPSEHLIGGRNFPMEAHFVHRTAAGDLAVLAVLMTGGGSNTAFSRVAGSMPKRESAALTPASPIDPKDLLPGKLGYYRYEGSLTTPPCSEIVDWLVLTTPISVADRDIAAFARLYPNNARPAQKNNRRFVLQSN
jgi:carbonic anhydrase